MGLEQASAESHTAHAGVLKGVDRHVECFLVSGIALVCHPGEAATPSCHPAGSCRRVCKVAVMLATAGRFYSLKGLASVFFKPNNRGHQTVHRSRRAGVHPDNPAMLSHKQATGVGLIAIVLWSSVVGLIRSVSMGLGATGGAAMIYTLGALLLVLTAGFTRLRTIPRAYLGWGSLLFVAYEWCLSLSIGYANTAQQAIEVGMVNYLWPTFTLLAAIAFNGQRANGLIVPGVLIALAGICQVLAGERGLDLAGMLANIRSNPLSYGLAFLGAVLWAAYCTVTARMARGQNGITLFVALTALTLWAKYFIVGGEPMHWSLSTGIHLAFAAAMGLGYGAWNVGILHGNVTLLAGASYFTPVFSAALAAALLQVPLTPAFWLGTGMVCGEAVLCWLATRGQRRD